MSDTDAPKHTPDEVYLRWMEEYHKESKRRESYSVARIDLMVVSISGAGLYICFESIRFILQHSATIPQLQAAAHWPLTAVGALFAVAIMANFASQHFGFQCNKAAALWARYAYRQENENTTYDEASPLEKKRDRFGRWTDWMNIASTVLMVIGVIGLIVFNYCLL